jgi:hypothetical protein
VSDAEAHVREAIVIHRTRPENERTNAGTAFWIGSQLRKAGLLAESEDWNRLALLSESKDHQLPDWEYAQMVQTLVDTLQLEQKFSEIEMGYGEWVQSVRARLPADDPTLATLLASIAAVLLQGGKLVEAEPLARECLSIREKGFHDDWLTLNARSELGTCLLGQKKYAEAEPLLLSGYEGLKKREDKVPLDARTRIRETIQDLIRLYEVTERPEKVVAWKAELAQWYGRAAARYRNAAETGDAEAVKNVAWFLATCVDAAVRDGPGAVAYAEKAVARMSRPLRKCPRCQAKFGNWVRPSFRSWPRLSTQPTRKRPPTCVSRPPS